MPLGKDKLNVIKVLISKALIDSCISQVVSVKNALREYDEMEKGIKKFEKVVEYTIRLI